jgi:hypothetical protein
MFQRTRKPAFAIAFVVVAQLNIRRFLMLKTKLSKCKDLVITSKNQQIPIFKSLNQMKMNCATSTFIMHCFSFIQVSHFCQLQCHSRLK